MRRGESIIVAIFGELTSSAGALALGILLGGAAGYGLWDVTAFPDAPGGGLMALGFILLGGLIGGVVGLISGIAEPPVLQGPRRGRAARQSELVVRRFLQLVEARAFRCT